MDTREYIELLEAQLAFYSNESKPEREAWVVRNFIEILGVQFEKAEIRPGLEEPIDVEFREGRFQIKEVMDVGRLRTGEIKLELKRARECNESTISTIQSFDPQFLSTEEHIARMVCRMEQTAAGYDESISEVDLLFYANLSLVFTTDKVKARLQVTVPTALTKWRSISVVTGRTAAVLHASETAPAFLKEAKGWVHTNRI